jgi:hypothetical protein
MNELKVAQPTRNVDDPSPIVLIAVGAIPVALIAAWFIFFR